MYQWMDTEILEALAYIADEGVLDCIIDVGSYSKTIMTRYCGLGLYFTSEIHRWNDCAIKDVPGLGGNDASQFNYVRTRETLKKMGITENFVRKAAEAPGRGVEIRAGTST